MLKLMRAQGWYFVLTGTWPLINMRIDIIYSMTGRISKIYLLDAIAELMFATTLLANERF